MSQLVLSLFPGIGLLDMAFEEEGFCVVRGPDLLWGGDVRRFHPPADRFDGVIGGPPCQAFSRLRHMAEANGYQTAPNLIPEYERCITEAQPRWFLMENVPAAPEPLVEGYEVRSELVRDTWVGGLTERLRRFSFGTVDGRRLPIDTLALHGVGEGTVIAGHGLAPGQRDKLQAVVCDARRVPVRLGGSGKVKPGAAVVTVMSLAESCRLQGLPEDFADTLPFTTHGKRKVVGNGVPLPMGRAVARAVKDALCIKDNMSTNMVEP
jgi:DNA (cytosine-5)-methyltransferase 1